MKQLLIACLLTGALSACNNKDSKEVSKQEGLEPISYTLYSAKTELFVEFKPLVVDTTSKFATHLTILGDNFLPYTEGTVTVTLFSNGDSISNIASSPGSPGIYRLELKPRKAGIGKLVFDIRSKDITDQIIIDGVEIYTDEKTAINNQPDEVAGNDITYLKEQAWKVEFANAPVMKQTMHEVIKATGQIISAPGDEVTVAAKSNGIVKFTGQNNVIGSAIRSGQSMFAVAGGDVAGENIDAAIQTATAELKSAKSEYDRASELMKDKLITQKQFEDARLRYEASQITLNNLSKNYGAAGKNLSAPINGYIKNILVSEGQYVTAGQPLATITKNQRFILRADVSLKDADRMSSIEEATFTIIQNKMTYNTKQLNARLISIAKTVVGNSPFIPVHFEMDSSPGIISGSFAEVYLKTTPIYNALAIPVSALIEEQGIFYAYVQTAGESFQKRELKLGSNDGEKVQVLSGLNEGERVVTKGAYQIKLSSMSGTMPAHGHEH